MRKALLVAAFLLLPATAHAQQWLQFSNCGTAPRTLVPGTAATIGVDLNGSLCINGSISVAISPPTVNNPWVTNVAQFGGANVVTGTGVSGAGVPRVTVSNDSVVGITGSLSATVTSAQITNTVNNPVVSNITQFGSANVVTGTGPSGAGIPRVTMSNDSSISITPPTVNSPWVDNIAQFGGSNVVTGTGTGGAGIPRVTISSDSTVGITGTPTVTFSNVTLAATPLNIAIAPAQVASGAYLDGAITAQGSRGDTAYGGSGSSTIIGILKGLYSILTGSPNRTITNTVNNPIPENVSQFGGSNVVTGTGPSGAGVPRMTMSNDSSISITPPTVNSPWVDNIAQFGGSNVVTGTGASGAGIPRVTVANDSSMSISGTPTVTFTSVTLAATPVNIAIAPAQVASGAFVDGAINTLGSQADTAWSSGNGTLIAVAKKIANNTASGGSNVTVVNTVNNPVPDNIAQFGGSNVVTGTGASGAGIPRVTVANDSTVFIGGQPISVSGSFSTTVTSATIVNTVNNPVVDNITQFGSANVVTGTGVGGAGIPRVTVSSDSTVGVSGTVTVTEGSVTIGNTVNNPVVGNITQFGSANVVTGTGTGGAGIPRVTVSSDSSMAVSSVSGTVTVTEGAVTIANTVNNPVPNNVSQFGGSNVVTGTGNSGAGIPRVTVASDSGIAITSLIVTPLNIAIAPSQVASGAFLDGSITAIGSRLDTAWVSGAGTVIAVLKAVATSVGNLYSFFSNGSNLIGTVSPAASPWGLNTTGSAPIATSRQFAAVATSSEPTKYTANQIQIPVMDLAAKLIVSPYAGRENFISGTVSASTTGVKAVIASPTNTTFSNYITDFNCTRNDTGTTAITVTTNETTTDGVQGASGWAIPNTGGGGGFMKHFSVPIKVAAGKAFQIQILTAVTSVMCTAQGYLGY